MYQLAYCGLLQTWHVSGSPGRLHLNTMGSSRVYDTVMCTLSEVQGMLPLLQSPHLEKHWYKLPIARKALEMAVQAEALKLPLRPMS